MSSMKNGTDASIEITTDKAEEINEDPTAAVQQNPADFNVTNYFQATALKSQSTYIGTNHDYDNSASSASHSEYLHSIISRAESELTKQNHPVASEQSTYTAAADGDTNFADDEENERKKRRRTNYKDPERLAVLTEAVNVLVGRLNNDLPLDMRSVSKQYNIPYNTLRDNYLKTTTGSVKLNKPNKS